MVCHGTDHAVFGVHVEVKSRDSPVRMEIIADPSVTHLMLEPLDPHSYYTFQVIAHTAAGDGQPIARRNATLFDGGISATLIQIFCKKTSGGKA